MIIKKSNRITFMSYKWTSKIVNNSLKNLNKTWYKTNKLGNKAKLARLRTVLPTILITSKKVPSYIMIKMKQWCSHKLAMSLVALKDLIVNILRRKKQKNRELTVRYHSRTPMMNYRKSLRRINIRLLKAACHLWILTRNSWEISRISIMP